MQAAARHVWRLSAVALALTALSLAPGRAASPKLIAIVKPAVAAAVVNFRPLHTSRSATNHYDYIQYATTSAFARICRYCTVTDAFAGPKNPERWMLGWDWYYHGKQWTPGAIATDAAATLGPVLKGYKLARSMDGARYVLDWEGPDKTWVYLETNDPEVDDPGFHINVGHDVAKPINVIKTPPFTAVQRSDITTALTSYLKLGLTDAPNNFTSMRGAAEDPKLFKADHFEPYHCAVSFAPGMDDCGITGLLNYSAAKWMLEAQTIAIGGTPEQARAFVHALVVAALPYGYTVESDPIRLMNADYEWNGPSDISISYNSSVTEGKTSFRFTIWHFLRQ
ncbi:MAG TPA: hypothetical protein VIG46_11590 [Candidatus Baltobacteraceae bacterium]|jgi:hypothetical protein